MEPTWTRPVPTIGDTTSAAERAADVAGWALPRADRQALARVIAARRDIRRFRPDPVPDSTLRVLLEAAHSAPSVGHSQPWRFVTVTDPKVRARAAMLADRARLAQAGAMEPEAARHLLDLDLEGIREAPLGIVVCCDRRVPPQGVLGRATFQDADLWSCACAIQNLWLSARAEGLGVGWVTLFEPGELAELVKAPQGVETLGWLCVGWPDERPPSPGLERRGWSKRVPLESVVMAEGWQEGVAPPRSKAAASEDATGGHHQQRPGSWAFSLGPTAAMPAQQRVVAARDAADAILSAPGSLGVLDRVLDRVLAVWPDLPPGGTLVIAAADHPVRGLGVSAYRGEVTKEVALASVCGRSVGAVAAATSGLEVVVVDAGVEGGPLVGTLLARPEGPRGDLVNEDALTIADAEMLLEAGQDLGRTLSSAGPVALGEVGMANTTVAAALTAALLGLGVEQVVGLGAGSDSAMVERKAQVVQAALDRVSRCGSGPASAREDPVGLLAALGGPEVAFLAGVTRGVAEGGGVVILDGLATSVAALLVASADPAVAAHLVAGQRSRERGHRPVLEALGLEPLLDLRLRAGEGVGACLAAGIMQAGLQVRARAARTA